MSHGDADGLLDPEPVTVQARDGVLIETGLAPEPRAAPRSEYAAMMRKQSFMDWIDDEDVRVALADAAEAIAISEAEVAQRFKGIYYPQHPERFRAGAFRYVLSRQSASLFALRIEVRVKIVEKGGAGSGVVARAQQAITDYWGGHHFSRGNTRVTIIPTIYEDAREHDFVMHVYADAFDDPLYEGITDYECNVRESFSFAPIGAEQDTDYAKKGRFPHEYGHMIGLPHDMYCQTVMHSQEAKTGASNYSNSYEPYWIYGYAEATPRAGHFKPARIWTERVLREQFGEHVALTVETG